MNPRSLGHLFTWLFLLTLSLVLIPLVGISAYALVAFEHSLLPQLDQKILTVGLSTATKLERALNYNIPFQRIEGVAEFFGAILKANPDLTYLAITDRDGKLLYQSGAATPAPDAFTQATATALGAAPLTESGAPRTSNAATTPAEVFTPLVQGLGIPLSSPTLNAQRLGEFYNAALPLRQGGTLVGALHVGAEARFITRQITDIMFDIGIVFVAAALVAFELLMLTVNLSLLGPLRQLEITLRQIADGDLTHTLPVTTNDDVGRLAQLLNRLVERLNTAYQQVLHNAETLQTATLAAYERLTRALKRQLLGFAFAPDGQAEPYREARLMGARTATFLFMFAAELSQPFMPIYARLFATVLHNPPSQLLIGLPLSVFMLVAALAMPLGGARFERVGYRQAFMEGASLFIIGVAGTGLAFGFYDLLGWRALAAVGYAFMFSACQGYIVANTAQQNQAWGGALFVGGIMAASICGPAIGGILADRIGYTPTFLCGAALAASAALLVLTLLKNEPTAQQPGKPVSASSTGAFRPLLTNVRFMVLMLFAAIPAKLLLNGFLFFLVPLTLTELGDSRSEIGRVAMNYGLATLLLIPLFARLADRFNKHGLLVGVGGLLAGIGLIPILFLPTSPGITIGVLTLGIGQAMSISPQLALVTQICKSQIERCGRGPVLGFYRLIERLGGAAGPCIAASFASAFGYSGAVTATGILGVVTATLFCISFMMLGPEPKTDSESPPKPR